MNCVARIKIATQAHTELFALELKLREVIFAHQRDQLAKLFHVNGGAGPLRRVRLTRTISPAFIVFLFVSC